ncbi:MAG: molybdate ABC transporter substrate-binding protein [Candidatus Omnitrophota bacterium]
MRNFVICLIIVGVIAGCSIKKNVSKELEIYVPCSVFGAFCDILDQYKKEHPDLIITFDTGNTVVLMRKVLHKGRRPDIYMGTGPFETDPIEKKGLIEPGTKTIFSQDSVILTTHASNRANVNSIDDLLSDRVKTIAIPDAGINSSGHFTVEAFKKLGVWGKIKDKVLFTQYGRESRTFIIKDKVDAGVMYTSCLYEDLKPGEKIVLPGEIRIVDDILKKVGIKIPSYACVLKTSKNKEEAKKFVDFLLSDFAQKALKEWGGGL